MTRHVLLKIAAVMVSAAAVGISPAYAQSSTGQITVLYDAFGKTSTMKKDWGFSALIEYGGKRILFDTGNNAEIFAHNVEAKGIDLKQLDFAVVSHRHGDHTSGLNHLLKINPGVKIYAPQENFGVFGAALPGTFYSATSRFLRTCAISTAGHPRRCVLAARGLKATLRG
jgi:7,8-dihydropterin-6-yl-methyl-4-(beta-D-ribofuranosyl)aminobenzene 5'-phosphate synthase